MTGSKIPILSLMRIMTCLKVLTLSLAAVAFMAIFAAPVAQAGDSWNVKVPGLAESQRSLPRVPTKRHLPPRPMDSRIHLTPAMQQALTRYRFELKGAERRLARSRYRAGFAATQRLNTARAELSQLNRLTGRR